MIQAAVKRIQLGMGILPFSRFHNDFFLVSYVEERQCRPIQSPNNGSKKKRKAKRRERSDQVY